MLVFSSITPLLVQMCGSDNIRSARLCYSFPAAATLSLLVFFWYIWTVCAQSPIRVIKVHFSSESLMYNPHINLTVHKVPIAILNHLEHILVNFAKTLKHAREILILHLEMGPMFKSSCTSRQEVACCRT